MTPQEKQALQMVEELLCLDLTPALAQARTFASREGYRTVFTGIYRNVTSVTVDGVPVEYEMMFNDKNWLGFYNSIVLKNPVQGKVTVVADWGFTTYPADLQRLIDNALVVAKKAYTAQEVKSKRIEDFNVTYSDLSTEEAFLKQNAITIRKYSMCNIGNIQHGNVCHNGRI